MVGVTLAVAAAGAVFYFATPLFFLGLAIAFFATRPKKNRYGNRGKRKWGTTKKKRAIPGFHGRRQYLVRCLVRWDEVHDLPASYISTRGVD